MTIFAHEYQLTLAVMGNEKLLYTNFSDTLIVNVKSRRQDCKA
jgi:hypothetical protein